MPRYLEGPRVKLVKFSNRHITAEYMSWVNDPDVSRYLEMGRLPLIRDEIYMPADNTLMFAIMVPEYIGIITIHNINWIDRRACTGYMIGDKTKWNNGYAQESLKIVCDYAFNRMGLNKLNADALVDNVASNKVLVNCGFKMYGIDPQHYFLEGKYLDNAMYYRLK